MAHPFVYKPTKTRIQADPQKPHSGAFDSLWHTLSSTSPPKPGHRPTHKNSILEHLTIYGDVLSSTNPGTARKTKGKPYEKNCLLNHFLAYGFLFMTVAQDFNI
jgi:hypothetical protein